MRAKTFAEHRIRQYLETVYPGLDGHMETVNAHEAIAVSYTHLTLPTIYSV